MSNHFHFSKFLYQNSLSLMLTFSSLCFAAQLQFDSYSPKNLQTINLVHITFGGGLFIAVGDSGVGRSPSGKIFTSPDGIKWTSTYTLNGIRLIGACYGNDQYVAVGHQGTILTSPDAVSWTLQNSGTAGNLQTVIYGKDQYVAAGFGNSVLTSPDGIKWTSNTLSGDFCSVAYGNNMYALADGSLLNSPSMVSRLFSSPDGIKWTLENFSNSIYTIWTSMTFGDSLFLATGYMGDIGYSYDAVNWSKTGLNMDEGYFLRSVCFGDNKYVVVGDSGYIYSSENGTKWSKCISNETITLGSIAYGNDRFVVIGVSGKVLISSTETVVASKVSSGTDWKATFKIKNKLISASLPFSVNNSSLKIDIFDLSGNKLHSAVHSPDSRVIDIPDSKLPNGTYLVEISNRSEKKGHFSFTNVR